MSRVPSLRYPIEPLPAPYPWRRLFAVLFVGFLLMLGAAVVLV